MRPSGLLVTGILVVTCLALLFSAPVGAAPHILKAPKESLSIKLAANDPPAEVVLKDWYCLSSDDEGDALDPDRWAGFLVDNEVRARTAPGEKPDPLLLLHLIARVNWGYNPVEIAKALIDGNAKPGRSMKNLDAPAGDVRLYAKANCYLQTEIFNFVYTVSNVLTRRMQEIIRSQAAPGEPEEMTKHQRWYVEPPRLYPSGPVKRHHLVITVERAANTDPAKRKTEPKKEGTPASASTDPGAFRSPALPPRMAGEGDGEFGPYDVGRGTLRLRIKARTVCTTCRFTILAQWDNNRDGRFGGPGDRSEDRVFDAGYDEIKNIDVKREIRVEPGQIRFVVSDSYGANMRWSIEANFIPEK